MTETAVFCNTKMLGGGERSAQKMLETIRSEGIEAHGWSLTPHLPRCLGMEDWQDWRLCSAQKQIWVMNDKINGIQKELFTDFMTVAQHAEDIRIVINFTHNNLCGKDWLTSLPVKKVIFLNSGKRDDWVKKCRHGNETIPTAVMPPPVDVERLLGYIRPSWRGNLRIGSHGGKHADDSAQIFKNLSEKNPGTQFHFLPGNAVLRNVFLEDTSFFFHPKALDMETVIDFLGGLDIYVYHLNGNSHTQGPRTVIEAMAMGLPVVTDNCKICGMRDRIRHKDTGYLCNTSEEITYWVQTLIENPTLRKTIGDNARAAAREMRPEKWLEVLL